MNIAPSFITQVLNDAGQLASGALVYFYESKTSPVVCNAYGRATIFGQGVYSVMITAADGTSMMR